ncbi:mTERF family protein [Musa troglodytarum]|uniref:mTERF family protein n=1 Tax=Musa troglodytarum TaxID=320322 RepID=A0A9E7L8C8_9LILI|nr:mTERF family protein [Musa troglodytarum]
MASSNWWVTPSDGRDGSTSAGHIPSQGASPSPSPAYNSTFVDLCISIQHGKGSSYLASLLLFFFLPQGEQVSRKNGSGGLGSQGHGAIIEPASHEDHRLCHALFRHGYNSAMLWLNAVCNDKPTKVSYTHSIRRVVVIRVRLRLRLLSFVPQWRLRLSAPYSAAIASFPCSKPAAFEISSSSPPLVAGTCKGNDTFHLASEDKGLADDLICDDEAKFSKPLAHLRSTEKPDAVVNFMRSQGFDGAGIRKVISLRPIYLCCNVEKNLAPKFQFLRDLGLSESDIVDAIVSNHGILGLDVHRSIVPKLEMWESLLGSRELVLMHLKKTGWFFCSSVEKTLLPNLKFLRDECGIPEERVSLVLRSCPQFISQKPESLRSLVARADELGVPRQSRMFVRTLVALQMKSGIFYLCGRLHPFLDRRQIRSLAI